MMNVLPYWRSLIVLCALVFLFAGIDQKTKNALKVQHILKTIERHQPRPNQKELTAEVTQTELNDYIAFRLAREKNTAVRRLNVILLENNFVSGTARLDAKSIGLGVLFGDVLNIDFMGAVQSRDGSARMHWRTLKLNGQSVNPDMLDTVVQAAAQYNGAKTRSIQDWYEMPKGVKRINVQKNRATALY